MINVITGSDLTVQVFNVNLFNVRSGELLSTIDVESKVTCLAACPLNRILAIGLKNSTPNVKLLMVFLPRSKDRESGKRSCGATLKKADRMDVPLQAGKKTQGQEKNSCALI